MVHSFDVFDTCLTRTFAAPSDLFLELGRRILRKAPPLAQHVEGETLWAARMEAERCVRSASMREEVTLDEICVEFAHRTGLGEWPVLAALELELEDECLRPIACTLQEIEALRAARGRIAFISDTYLPRTFVERQLRKHGFIGEGDSIYVSSEFGVTKATGNLFKKVLADEKIKPRELRHCGDNAATDLAAPQRLGIAGRLVEHRRVSPAEAALLGSEGIDYNVRSKLVGAMQTSRLPGTSNRPTGAAAVIANVVNPLVFAFASWTLAQAQRDGVRRLYFLSRDCQTTYLAAKELAGEFGGIECRYLHVSRQSLLLPTANDVSEAGMPWLRRRFETPTLERLLAKLELSYADVESDWAARCGSRRGKYLLRDDGDWERFWTSLNREPLGSRLRGRIQERRIAAQAYFRMAGLLEPITWAAVDLGWHLSCQSALRALLRGMNPAAECRGYYLGLRRDRLASVETGKATALFHQRGPDLPGGIPKQFLFQHATLFEHVLGLADHHGVHHYEGMGKEARPVLQGAGEEPAHFRMTRAVHESVRRFAAENAALAPEIGSSEVASAVFSGVGATFAQNPSKEVSQALAAVEASGDQNNLSAALLGAPLQARELAALWLPGRFRRIFGSAAAGPTVWIEGRLAASRSSVRWLYALRKSLGARRHSQTPAT